MRRYFSVRPSSSRSTEPDGGLEGMNRRRALQLMGAGFGMVGLADVLHGAGSAGSLAPRQPHFPPKATNVIFLFLNGGLSHLDTFDPKPELTRQDGQPMPGPRIQNDRAAGRLHASHF